MSDASLTTSYMFSSAPAGLARPGRPAEAGAVPAPGSRLPAPAAAVPDLHALIMQAGLGDPSLSSRERGARVRRVADQAGVALGTVYTHIKRVAAGQPARKARADRGACRTLPPQVQSAARALFASPTHRRKSTATLLRELQHRFPEQALSRSSVERLRAQVEAELASYGKSYATIQVADPNEQWQIDCSTADLFAVHPKTGRPFRPQLTLCLDAATRSIMYARYAVAVPYVEIGGVLYQAVRKQSEAWPQHGLPRSLVMDNGKVFVGHNLEAALKFLGIAAKLSHPYYPQDKGKCERAIGTVHQMFEQTCPGYCGSNNQGDLRLDPDQDFREVAPGVLLPRGRGASPQPLLTLSQLNSLLWDWIAGTYNHHRNEGLRLTPNSPPMSCLQAWVAGWYRLQSQPETYDDDYLVQGFLPCEVRVVRRGRVLINGFEYLAPELTGCNGCEVQVRYTPDDIREIVVYLQGRRLCVARVDVPFLHTAPQDVAAWQQTRRERREQDRARRDAVATLVADPAARADLTQAVRAAAARAPGIFTPDATVVPDPAQLAAAHDAETDDFFMGPIPTSATG